MPDTEKKTRERWILATNRLPYSWDSDSQEFRSSSGGLISAVTAIQTEAERVWVGAFSKESESIVRSGKGFPPIPGIDSIVPVWLEDTLYDRYYNGMANSVLWPLFHYEGIDTEFHDMDWDAYVAVNRLFAEEVAKNARPGDLVWVHDFHLFLLPQFLKELNPDLRVGFFLHIPFPSSEIFRELPVREELLKALLHADLVGFHDYSYLRHFCSTIQAVLGITSSTLTVSFKGHEVKLGVFPVGIDTPGFKELAAGPEVENRVRELRAHITTPQLLLGVDRLDYIKGIDLKLQAFSEFLTRYPEARGQVSLLQIAVPTRTDVVRYRKLRNHIEQLVGKINGTFGRPGYTPVNYMYSTLPKTDLIALYRMAQALLITSKRDGMNLVALEYLASQDPNNPGSVLLSEFTGAVSTLSDAITINPWDLSSVAENIRLALDKSSGDRIFGYARMMEYLDKYTATEWARVFMKVLREGGAKPLRPARTLPDGVYSDISKDWAERLREEPLTLLLDFDGTLVPLENHHDQVRLPDSTRELVGRLAALDEVEVVVLSGRPKEFLEEQLADLDVYIAAEHGAQFRDKTTGKWETFVRTDYKRWYKAALNVIEDYYRRVPGSMVEKKNFGVCFHYRLSPKEFASYQVKKLIMDLEELLTNMPVSVLSGHCVVEVRAVEANKGAFARWFLDHHPGSLAVAIGDDVTDEEMFAALPPQSMSIRVGNVHTLARHRLDNQNEVVPFFQRLLDSRSGDPTPHSGLDRSDHTRAFSAPM